MLNCYCHGHGVLWPRYWLICRLRTVELTVIIPTHNPDRARLRRTLRGLQAQTLSGSRWETVLVDNASSPAVTPADYAGEAPSNLRLASEPQLGLTAARRRGFADAKGAFAVLVDDDNVLAPDYLERVIALFTANPRIGLIGGKSMPEFDAEPPEWSREFFGLLALLVCPSCLTAAHLPPTPLRLCVDVCEQVDLGVAVHSQAVVWGRGGGGVCGGRAVAKLQPAVSPHLEPAPLSAPRPPPAPSSPPAVSGSACASAAPSVAPPHPHRAGARADAWQQQHGGRRGARTRLR